MDKHTQLLIAIGKSLLLMAGEQNNDKVERLIGDIEEAHNRVEETFGRVHFRLLSIVKWRSCLEVYIGATYIEPRRDDPGYVSWHYCPVSQIASFSSRHFEVFDIGLSTENDGDGLEVIFTFRRWWWSFNLKHRDVVRQSMTREEYSGRS